MRKSFTVILLLLVAACMGQTGEIGFYYFVELIPTEESMGFGKPQLDSIQQVHLQNIRDMAVAKQLVLAGPFKQGGGILILKAADLEAAQMLVEKDPAVSAGRFSYTIREWYTERSMFTLESN